MSENDEREILNIEEAAALLGVSIKTFNKVLHLENLPARKIGREWKFSRQALIEWVGRGKSRDFYRETSDAERTPERTPERSAERSAERRPRSRRTQGWRIELD